MTSISNRAPPIMEAKPPRFGAMVLGALGVFYGDIGTSPLYTMKTVLDRAADASAPSVVLGMLSLLI